MTFLLSSGLEERKKIAASVTTVPLRQPLSANYKSMVTSTTERIGSFSGRYYVFCAARYLYIIQFSCQKWQAKTSYKENYSYHLSSKKEMEDVVA